MSYEFDRSTSGAGRAQPGGCFHLSFRSGSRPSGASGAATFEYITRDGRYDDPERDPAIFVESGNMPDWAAEDARSYWEAADLHERANGRLFVSADFALPRELSVEDRIELARTFARELTENERLPYTVAVHEGRGADGEVHNPHVHLMFSERQNDGIDRTRDQWFPSSQFEPARPGRRTEEPDVPRAAMEGAGTIAVGGPDERSVRPRRKRPPRRPSKLCPAGSRPGAG